MRKEGGWREGGVEEGGDLDCRANRGQGEEGGPVRGTAVTITAATVQHRCTLGNKRTKKTRTQTRYTGEQQKKRELLKCYKGKQQKKKELLKRYKGKQQKKKEELRDFTGI